MTPDPMEARFAMLRRVGGDKLIGDLIALFFETAPRRLEAIRAGVAGADTRAVARAAHSLTSSAGNLGCAEVQTLAADLEARGAAGDADALPELLLRLEEAWQAARDALDARGKALRP